MAFWNIENLKEALENANFYNFPDNWSSSGLIIWNDSMEQGNMILMRTPGQTKGMLINERSEEFIQKASALMAHNPSELFKFNKPIIELSRGNGDALIKLARYIRQHFSGKVIGITGSSGKSTTTQMLVDIFSSKYIVDSNIASKANTTWGITWNMTRFNPNGDYWIIETSLGGGMSRNSAITKPDYAIITNVAPVHLTNGMTLEDIAEEKSRIFHAMTNGTAIIYNEMTHIDIIKSAAEFKNLNIITFGESETADIRIVCDGENKFIIDNQTYILNSKPIGKHLLLDMAAALAVAKSENIDIEEALNILREFKTLEGRGETSNIQISKDKNIILIDESYNANPLSMKAAITAFGQQYKDEKKVLIIGDMAECGEESEHYHREIANYLYDIKPQKVILCGKDIKFLYNEIKENIDTEYFEKVEDIYTSIVDKLENNDCVLIKSSHSGNLHKLVYKLKHLYLNK